MESSYSSYEFENSRKRLDEILDAADAEYEEVDYLPARTRLTYTNGFYVNCSALFVDIRSSSQLAAKHKRPTLAKIYRAYISESVAVLKSHSKTREVSIHGDAVWGVYETPYKTDVDEVFSTCARARSLVDVLNHKLEKHGVSTIAVGVGSSWGRALMIKAGYKGSAINEVVWMGDVVNEAAHLAGFGRRTWSDYPVMVSRVFRDNLNEDNRKFLQWNSTRGCYHGNVVNLLMNDWLEAQS